MRNFSLLTVLSMALAGALFADSADNRPNLLFILTDDQRWDTAGFTGNDVIQTPEMDRLAAEGVVFREAFVTTPICAASRASFFSGVYERTHGFTFFTPPLGKSFIETSYPIVLREAGYRTGFVGKFGVSAPKGSQELMFDYYDPLNRTPYIKKLEDGTERHVTDLTGDSAIAFLDTVSADDAWCLSISFNAPHAEDKDPRQYISPEAVNGLYRDQRFEPPWSMNDAFFQSQPEFLRTSEGRVRFDWRFDEPQKYQEMVRGYYRMITGVDRVIGRIREALENRGLASNTVIIFTSDNGYFLGERGLADKWNGYEHSLRVPLVITDPRLPDERRGARVDLMALNIDVPLTLLEYAGVEPPPRYQGRSLIPLTKGVAPVDWREDFLFEHLLDSDKYNIPKNEGVRSARWTYMRWTGQDPVVEELYDHQVDFEEVHNLIDRPEYLQVLERLRVRTDELVKSYEGGE